MSRVKGHRANNRPVKTAECRFGRGLQRRDFDRTMEINKIELGLQNCFTNAELKHITSQRATAKVWLSSTGRHD